MAYKIDSIEVYNFKFFESCFVLPVHRKNILLFGENGSGKSSLFWSFYTHYQAVYKSQDDARKYFLHSQKESLRNVFSKPEDPSGIKVTYKDENNAELVVEDSDSNQSVLSLPIKGMMSDTMASSDFFNYKILSSFFDFKNSEDNEVFKVFEKDILQFLILRTALNIEGNNKGYDALTWWKYISTEYVNLPRNKKNYNDFNQNAPEYKSFIALIDNFNYDMRYALTQLIISANQIIHDCFSIPVDLTVRYDSAKFNQRVPFAMRSRDRKITPPRIILNAKIKHEDINTQEIQHPSSFFNEAKLTCMALAIRLAVLNSKPTEGTSYASALFVDDLLISLDMSYRRKVVDVLLDNTTNRQFLFFTHDRSLFHLVKGEIEARKQGNEWLYYELYSDVENNHPVPHLHKPTSPIDEAKLFLRSHQIPACANAIRRAFEKELRSLLPFNMQLKKDPQDTMSNSFLDFNGMVAKYEKLQLEIGLPDLAHGLSIDRKLLLNPFSHDDIDTPFYQTELERLIEYCEKLSSVKRTSIIPSQMIYNDTFKIIVRNGALEATAIIVFHEGMMMYSYEGRYYYTKPRVKVISCSVDESLNYKIVGIGCLYHTLYNNIHLNSTTCPSFKDVLFKNDGTLLVS